MQPRGQRVGPAHQPLCPPSPEVPRCFGQEKAMVAQSPARPWNSHTVALAVPAPGPRGAGAWPSTGAARPTPKRPPGTLTTGKQTLHFCGERPGQHTLRPGLVKPPRSSAWREEKSLPNRSRRTFSQHTGAWRGATAGAPPRQAGLGARGRGRGGHRVKSAGPSGSTPDPTQVCP